MSAVGNAASSTIAQPVGSQTKPTILSRAAVALRGVFFTSADLQKPDRLYQVISALQTNVASVVRSLASNVTLSSVRLSGNVFWSGQTVLINHGLGRPYLGWYVVRAQGGAASFVEAALPPGVDTSQAIAITSANAGTFDLIVF